MENDKRILMNKIKGFTLIEMSIVSAILLILAGAIFPSLQSAKKQPTLDRAAYKLSQDLKYTEQMAWETKIYEPLGTIPSYGYGIYFPSLGTSYTLYAECNGDLGGSPSTGLNGCGAGNIPEEIKNIEMEKGVQIEKICSFDDYQTYKAYKADPISNPPASCVAIAPETLPFFLVIFDPSQTMVLPNAYGNYVEITLSLKDDSSKKKVVLINYFGLVEVR